MRPSSLCHRKVNFRMKTLTLNGIFFLPTKFPSNRNLKQQQQTTQTSHSHYYNVHCLWVCFILYISLFKFESKGVYLRDKNGFLFVGINEISSAAAWLLVCSQRPPYGSLSSMLMLCVCFVCFWLWRGTLKKEANSMQRENKRQTFWRYEFRICGQCFNRFDWFAMFVPFSLSLSIYLRPLTTFARNVKTEINRSST